MEKTYITRDLLSLLMNDKKKELNKNRNDILDVKESLKKAEMVKNFYTLEKVKMEDKINSFKREKTLSYFDWLFFAFTIPAIFIGFSIIPAIITGSIALFSTITTIVKSRKVNNYIDVLNKANKNLEFCDKAEKVLKDCLKYYNKRDGELLKEIEIMQDYVFMHNAPKEYESKEIFDKINRIEFADLYDNKEKEETNVA
ncbi:MAG: hypothetical protein KBT30_01935 [Clostridiales bacterium]|nr:hypothetical protein [Candidatus Apopatousia equi]